MNISHRAGTLPRRGFLGGIIAALVSPAVVRVESLMPVRTIAFADTAPFFLTPEMITREALKILRSNLYPISAIDRVFEGPFYPRAEEFGRVLKIRRPHSFSIATIN